MRAVHRSGLVVVLGVLAVACGGSRASSPSRQRTEARDARSAVAAEQAIDAGASDSSSTAAEAAEAGTSTRTLSAAETQALEACSRYVIDTTSSPATACRALADDVRLRALPIAMRACEAGDPRMCFAQAILTTGQLPISYRAALMPHSGVCVAGNVCRIAATRFVASRISVAGPTDRAYEPIFAAACERGSIEACLWHGVLLGDSSDAAVAPLMRACTTGRPSACVVPIDRLPALHPDSVRALDALQRSCDESDPIACAILGTMAAEGYLRRRDPRAAVALFSRACGSATELELAAGAPPDDPATLADERYDVAALGDRFPACGALLIFAERDAGARRALRRSAALAIVSDGCANGPGSRESCAALERVLSRGLAGRADRVRAALVRRALCQSGERASCE